MTILDLIVLLVVAGICGALAQSIVGYSRGGCMVSIVLGFIGALLGTWLARLLALPELFTLGDRRSFLPGDLVDHWRGPVRSHTESAYRPAHAAAALSVNPYGAL